MCAARPGSHQKSVFCYLFAYYAPVYRCVQSCQLLFSPQNDKKAKFLLFSTKKIQLAKRLIMSPINPLHYIEMFMTTTNYNSQKMVSVNNELPPRLHMRLTAYVTCILHIYFFQFKSKESSWQLSFFFTAAFSLLGRKTVKYVWLFKIKVGCMPQRLMQEGARVSLRKWSNHAFSGRNSDFSSTRDFLQIKHDRKWRHFIKTINAVTLMYDEN